MVFCDFVVMNIWLLRLMIVCLWVLCLQCLKCCWYSLIRCWQCFFGQKMLFVKNLLLQQVVCLVILGVWMELCYMNGVMLLSGCGVEVKFWSGVWNLFFQFMMFLCYSLCRSVQFLIVSGSFWWMFWLNYGQMGLVLLWLSMRFMCLLEMCCSIVYFLVMCMGLFVVMRVVDVEMMRCLVWVVRVVRKVVGFEDQKGGLWCLLIVKMLRLIFFVCMVMVVVVLMCFCLLGVIFVVGLWVMLLIDMMLNCIVCVLDCLFMIVLCFFELDDLVFVFIYLNVYGLMCLE